MIAVASQFRDWDVALLLLVLGIAMFTTEMIEGWRKYRAGRQLARQITEEHQARKALEELRR